MKQVAGNKGFALVNNASQINGGMQDTVVNTTIDLGDIVLMEKLSGRKIYNKM